MSHGRSCVVGDALCPASQRLKGFLTFVQQPLRVRVVGRGAAADAAAASDGDATRHFEDVGPAEPTITAAGCGSVEITEQILSVRGLYPRYNAEVGDVVIARVVDVSGSRWMCDLGAAQHASLPLSNVTEPGGMLRRRGRDDELSMRSLFREGDLVVCEVQRVMSEGNVLLHTRSANKYGRCLGDGVCVPVRPHLVRREGRQFVAFDFGVSAIIGVNGNIWVCITTQATLVAMNASWGSAGFSGARGDGDDGDDDAAHASGDDEAAAAAGAGGQPRFRIHTSVAAARLDVARMRCCLLAMSAMGCRIDASCMQAAFQATLDAHIPVATILDYDSPARAVIESAVGQARATAERISRFEE
jgi:exosome complex RNA-binding protein Rrp4